jgi:DNA-binding CsgD family transcriptional regulator
MMKTIEQIMEKPRRIVLSEREREVLVLVCRALSDSEIADQLCVSISTVKNSIHSACIKLGASNRFQAALLAVNVKALHFLDIFSFDELLEMARNLGPAVTNRLYIAIDGTAHSSFREEDREPRPRDPQLGLLLRRLEMLPDEKGKEMAKAFIRFILKEEEKNAKRRRQKDQEKTKCPRAEESR